MMRIVIIWGDTQDTVYMHPVRTLYNEQLGSDICLMLKYVWTM